MLVSCSNDLDKVKQFTAIENIPDETSTGLHLVQTDSGRVQYELFGKLVESVTMPTQKTKIKDGLEVRFYNKGTGELEAILTAYYGEREAQNDKMMVRDSVIVKNIEKGQQLETEELYWQNDSIFTKKAVVVRTQDEILWGKGIIADQSFSKFVILQPTGQKKMNE
jgi:LPS export ABC transporter protein LptC